MNLLLSSGGEVVCMLQCMLDEIDKDSSSYSAQVKHHGRVGRSWLAISHSPIALLLEKQFSSKIAEVIIS